MSGTSASEAIKRKRELIAAGSAYRSAVGEARQQVKANLQVESLARKAMGQLALAAVAAFKSRKNPSLVASGARTLLPLLISGASMLSKKTAAKPIVRKVVLAGVAGAAIAFLAKRKIARWREERARTSRANRRA
jgi:hypothetical protein